MTYFGLLYQDLIQQKQVLPEQQWDSQVRFHVLIGRQFPWKDGEISDCFVTVNLIMLIYPMQVGGLGCKGCSS
ncbi:MAG: hypothetical protein H6974_09305 [Gammaproteobacteria bacterium]|nr:hypothetical protein [Gammaproteobacteria bacterium]